MSAQPRILYIHADRGTGSATPRPAAIPGKVECSSPECLGNRSALSGYSAVIVDGHSLGAQSIAVAKRIRWLGIEGPVLLAWDSAAALDQAIARDCGVDVVSNEGLATGLAEALASSAAPWTGNQRAQSGTPGGS